MDVQIKSEINQYNGQEEVLASKDELFFRTMSLAYYLLPEKQIAAQIARESINLARIKNYQKEAHRRHWLTHNKYKDGGGPSKALLQENQLIQFFVFFHAEKYEQYHEGNSDELIVNKIRAAVNDDNSLSKLLSTLLSIELSVDDLIIRYLKSVVLYSRNNPADLITAISCLICNLSPKEATTVYSVFKAVSPNYCSKRKLLLMERLAERFDSYIKYCKPNGKQTYFIGQDQVSSQHARLVESFFTLATPWATNCPTDNKENFSERFNSWLENLLKQFKRRYFTKEDQIDMAQIHAFLCPDCFSQLMHEMIGECPRARLALPTLSLTDKGNYAMSKNNRQLIPDQETIEQARQASTQLEREALRRAQAVIEQLIITVDDQEQILQTSDVRVPTLDLANRPDGWFNIKKTACLLKVFTQDGEGLLPIAVMILNQHEIDSSWGYRWHYWLGGKNYWLALPNNQWLIVNIRPALAIGQEDNYLITVKYQTRPFWSNSISNWLKKTPYLREPQTTSLPWTLPLSLALILLVVFTGLFTLIDKPTEQPISRPPVGTEPTPGSTTDGSDRGTQQPLPQTNPVTQPQLAVEIVKFDLEMAEAQTSTGSEEKIKTLKIPAGAKLIRLDLKSDAKLTSFNQDQTQSLVASLQAVDLDSLTVWRSSQLREIKQRSGYLVSVDIPARIFTTGRYRLEINSDNSAKQAVKMQCVFNVEKI